jgi:hypothetical protein
MHPRIGAALALAACTVTFMGPGRAAADRFQIGFPTAIHIEDEDGGRLTLRITDNGRTLKVDARGLFQLNEDETDLETISPGGTFRLEERRWGRTSHRYEVRGLPDGGIERVYRRGGDVHELDAEGRAWLADALSEVVLNTEFGLEHHLARVLERGGLDEALSEVQTVGGDHAQREAYRFILDRADVDSAAAVRIIESAGRTMGSDHELAELLIDVTDRVHGDAVFTACARASERIGSGHERGRVLRGLVEQGSSSAETAAAMVASAAGIGSDHERAEVLIAIADSKSLDAALAKTYFDALRDIGSDHEKRRTLISVLAREPRDLQVLKGMVEAASSIGSDHERAEVLAEMARQQSVPAEIAPLWVESAGDIGSDHEHGRVLMDMLQSAALEPRVLELVIEDAATLGSDTRKADVLETVVETQRLEGDLREAFLRAAGTLGSDTQHRRVLRKLEDRGL